MVKHSDNILDQYPQYLDDESSIAKGTKATKIWFPINHEEVVEVMKSAIRENESVTISGGGTGISGGRAPLSGWILATDQMLKVSGENIEDWKDSETGIQYGIEFITENGSNYIRVPVGMSLKAIQNCVREKNLFYPPDPTERTSFIGGNVSTNASGARSFKFGATRNWVQALKVVLSNGESCTLTRGMKKAKQTNNVLVFSSENNQYSVPLPDLILPNVTKHVAGPVLSTESHPLDIFIGTNGIFGIVTEVKLMLLPAPTKIISMFAYCDSFEKALDLIQKCQNNKSSESYPVPMSVEYLDDRAIKVMQQKDSRITSAAAVVLLEQDIYSEEEEDEALMAWQEIFDNKEIDDISVALTHQENEHHKFLRHWVPEWLIKTTKDYGYSIFVSDTSVPPDSFMEFMKYLDNLKLRFEKETDPLGDLSATIIGHVGDSHPHLCFIPTDNDQAELANVMMNEILDKTVEFGGSIASEHGLGKKIFDNKPAIMKQYGEEGIQEVRKLKNILDPKYRLCPGNIVPLIK